MNLRAENMRSYESGSLRTTHFNMSHALTLNVLQR